MWQVFKEASMNEPSEREDISDQVTPIATFSQCHVGIIENLDSLGKLPALVAAAEQARSLAQRSLDYFDDVVVRHHAEEEQELFPAVLQSAVPGEERRKVEAVVAHLAGEHRRIEALWEEVKPAIKQIAKGHAVPGSGISISDLIAQYRAHARYEEEIFLPLSEEILGRNGNHMRALGLSLHMRHARAIAGYI